MRRRFTGNLQVPLTATLQPGRLWPRGAHVGCLQPPRIHISEVNSGQENFDSTLLYPIFDVESIGDGPRVPRAHLGVVLTQLLIARAGLVFIRGASAQLTAHTHTTRTTRPQVHLRPPPPASGALASHDTACAKPSALLSKAQARAVEAPSAGHKAALCPPSGAAGSARSVTGEGGW